MFTKNRDTQMLDCQQCRRQLSVDVNMVCGYGCMHVSICKFPKPPFPLLQSKSVDH